ncbi:hypothetical protein EYC98_12305 [Halieaceae bacterium IMCC14734]|uniref:Uncharacterized protein n=1 Tax=Candidatus Litorirhabdus singularis TaxID=2518993 RepID=A0ABT3THF7_9GAMM|nr:hypothetical protein [Candidatus Litorirhabdus singularis]MCX2981645.1 hypothetical protein [Candidatus Litorirhabdus singularis]
MHRAHWSCLSLFLLLCLPVSMLSAAVDTRELNISLVVFDPGIPTDPTHNKELGIFPKIRSAEARYLPFVLRQVLVDSNSWGATRVIPDPDPGTELLITGRLLQSDGIQLSFELNVSDSRGQTWFVKTYSGIAPENAYQTGRQNGPRPFQATYDEVLADLFRYAQTLEPKALEAIRNLAFLRYAATLSPAAFGPYFDRDETGNYQLLRLPAYGDPMVARIEKVRQQEYVFVDTVDEQYRKLFAAMAPTYNLWRRYNREQAIYQEAYEERLADRSKPKSGSYQAMKRSYINFRWSKIQQQESAKLATGFNNEVAPTVMQLQGRVVELEGSLEEQYREWRRILQSIYQLEATEQSLPR